MNDRYKENAILTDFLNIIYRTGIVETARKANISENTIRSWAKLGVVPNLTRACHILESLGYTLKIEKQKGS